MKTIGSGDMASFAKATVGSEKRIVGAGSSAIKYDIITALLALASHDSGPKGRLATRLALVITARFNWRSQQFNVGQRELARMWGVTERTAKREIAHMRALGWIELVRSAARGRVAYHGIDFPAVMRDTRDHWGSVGPDFDARMSGVDDSSEDLPTNVVPISRKTESTLPQNDDLWSSVARQLHDRDPNLYITWFDGVCAVDIDGTTLVLLAPTRFKANYIETHLQLIVLAAVTMIEPNVRKVRVQAIDPN